MCNHYRNDLRKLEDNGASPAFADLSQVGGLQEDVWPDRQGLVLRREEDGARTWTAMRWGFPPVTDRVVTNARNLSSAYWRPWLSPSHRCVVPGSAFAEWSAGPPAGERWFERTDGGTLWFAGLWRSWTGSRGPRSARMTGAHSLFAILTCAPNEIVAPFHPGAMPVILEEEEISVWLEAPFSIAGSLQRPLPAERLRLAPASGPARLI